MTEATKTETAAAGTTTTAPPPGLDALTGEWASTTRFPWGVSHMGTAWAGGTLTVHLHGGNGSGDWGEVACDGTFTQRGGTAPAFVASFKGTGVVSTLMSNSEHGVMAVSVFHRFTDGSDRRDYFTREFYVPADRQSRDVGLGVAGRGFPFSLLTGRNDPSGQLGTWHALAPAATTLTSLYFAWEGAELTVRARGRADEGPVDWGTSEAQVFADAAFAKGPPGFLAAFRRDGVRMRLQARMNQGVMVVDAYALRAGAGCGGEYFREILYRR